MKKIILMISVIALMGVSTAVKAQNVSVNVSVNINSQPAWGPEGYEVANFYYFPDLNIYFDINNSLFYYLSGSKWISNRYLPNKYSRYDFYNLYKIVINDDPQPWLNHKSYKKQYSGYKNNKTQTPIRNSNNSQYSKSKNNSTVWVNNSNFEKKNTNKSNNKNSGNSNKQSQNNSSKNSQNDRVKENNSNKNNQNSQNNRVNNSSNKRSQSQNNKY